MAKKLFLIFLILLFAGTSHAVISSGRGGAVGSLNVYTVATLPASPVDGATASITDGADASDCTVGEGTDLNVCIYDADGAAWVIAGDGGGSGNSFSTHDTPVGTDPVAGAAGTLTWLDTAPIVITGDSAADSITVSVTTATTTAEGVSEWATDAEAVALTADRVVVASSLDNVLAAPPEIGGTTAGAITGSTVTSEGSFVIGGADMNQTDLEKLDGITNGTQAANKAVVADGNVNSGISKITQLHIGVSGSETQVTATAAELNLIDGYTGTAAQLSYLDAADGETGSGSVVFDDTPTLITPVLGAATGTSLTTSGGITDTGGDVSSGADITTLGTLNAYGNNSTGGGQLRLHNATDEDGTHDYWQIEANGANLVIDTSATADAFVFNADGSINKSATPKITLDDTDGADGYIDLNATDADDAVMTIGVDDSTGDDVSYIELDGVNERVEMKKPLTAPSIDAGILTESLTSSEDFTSTETNTSRKTFVMGSTSDANVEVELQTSGLVDTGIAREFYFYNNEDANFDFIIDPNSTDYILLPGIDSCGAGNPVYIGENGSMRLQGMNNTIWIVTSFTGAVACSTQQ